MTSASQLNSASLSTGILRKDETLPELLRHGALHFWLIASRNFFSKSFLISSFTNIVLVIDGRCPLASILPISYFLGGSVDEYRVILDAELTVTVSE